MGIATKHAPAPAPAVKVGEVRLGLVLYGGVSLAIYMNGVANELFRAVRGRGAYFLVKKLLRADVVVDVVSGASAGGINGIFLAFALANDREFGTCANLWRRDGALETLMRKPSELRDDVNSVLDSESYQGLLQNGFQQMLRNSIGGLGDAVDGLEDVSPCKELDLFVAGTDYYGKLSTEFDYSGNEIDVKDHRTVFVLKHRAGRKLQLDPAADQNGKGRTAHTEAGLLAFAKLSQITSCFPGAFAPVRVGAAGSCSPEEAQADEKLARWGRLRGETYFVDGGVLDNKPFTTTLEAIFHRTANRRVCRHLLYLEPDPERFGKKKSELKQPQFLANIFNSISKLPSYESIAKDLEAVSARNQLLQRFQVLTDVGETSVERASIGKDAALRDGDPEYIKTCYVGLAQLLLDELTSDPELLGSDTLTPSALQGLIGAMAGVSEIVGGGGNAAANRLAAIDVLYPLRRLMKLTYVLHEHIESHPESLELWNYANAQVNSLEIIRSRLLKALVPAARSEPGAFWANALQRAAELLRDEPELRAAQTDEGDSSLEAFKARLDGRIHASGAGANPASAQFAAGSDSVLVRMLREQNKRVAESGLAFAIEAFETFPAFDKRQYPLQLAAGIEELDQIRVTRLSPLDAQRGLSKRTLEAKICGDSLGHFGAFLKKSWRSNDILWGRLDGSSQLLETLLLRSELSSERPQVLDVDNLRDALGPTPEERLNTLQKLFPHLHKRASQAPSDDLQQLAWIIEETSSSELREASARSAFVEQLVRVAQLEILCQDLPTVIADAVEEQISWDQLRSPPRKVPEGGVRYDVKRWAFMSGGIFFNPSLVAPAVRRIAEEALRSMSPAELERYFENDYCVGGEEVLKSLPTTVLVELGARAALVTERALTSGSDQVHTAIRNNAAHRWLVAGPLRFLAALAAAVRRGPVYLNALLLFSVVYIVVCVVANVFLFGRLYSTDGMGRTVALLLFAGAPLLLGIVLRLFLFGGRFRFVIALIVISLLVALGVRFGPELIEGVSDRVLCLEGQDARASSRN